jgi:hypothetical protein
VKLVEDAQHTLLDTNFVPDFIKLAKAYDIHHKPRNKVNPIKMTVLTLLPDELDCAPTIYQHYRPIAKFDSPANADVKVIERKLGTSHMIGGDHVHDPALMRPISFSNLHKHMLLF